MQTLTTPTSPARGLEPAHPAPAPSTDHALIERIRSRDHSGLSEAYRLHGQAVLSAAFSVTRRKGLAEDVTQEVFVRLWNRSDRFDPGRGSLRAFLKIDARGRAIDALRSERSRRDREEKESRLTTSGDVAGVEEEVMMSITSHTVRGLLAKLPANQRLPIALAYFDGHSYREVAKRIRQPEGTVKSRIRAGLENLKNLLAEAGIEAV